MTFKKYKRVKVFYDYSIYCCSATSNSEFSILSKKGQIYMVIIRINLNKFEINCLMLIFYMYFS